MLQVCVLFKKVYGSLFYTLQNVNIQETTIIIKLYVCVLF